MTYAQSVLLGALQGLGEFLPISSSAHLVLAPWALRFEDPGLTFDVALHAGTLVAIAATFGARWWEVLAQAAREPRGPQGRRLLLLALATAPGAVAGLLLEKKAEAAFRDPRLVASALIAFGLIMGAAERWGAKARDWASCGWPLALAVGASQALALVPGVSRSGATMSAGLALGLTRESAADFSFMLSLPIIAGASLLKLRHLSGADLTGPFLTGVAVSALTGYAAVRVFLRGLSRWGLRPYVAYRVVLGAAAWALYLAR